RPLAVGLARFNDAVDKAYAQQTIPRVRIIERQRICRFPGPACRDCFRRIGINISKSIREALGVTSHQPRGARGEGQGARSVWRSVLRGTVQGFKSQGLRELLHPLERTLAATDADAQTIFHSGSGLRYPETSARPV